MADGDPLAAEKRQILEYARSVLPSNSRVVDLRWGAPGTGGTPLLADLVWGAVSVVVLPDVTLRSYGCDPAAREGIQRCLREALWKL